MPHKILESRIAGALGMNLEEFWKSIDEITISQFKQQALAGRES